MSLIVLDLDSIIYYTIMIPLIYMGITEKVDTSQIINL